jgi:hypothetical protein
MAVMQQSVEDRRRHDWIAAHATSFADRAVAGDQHQVAFVAAQYQPKELMRGVGLERQIAEPTR